MRLGLSPLLGFALSAIPLDERTFANGLALFAAMPPTISSCAVLTGQAKGNVALALLFILGFSLIVAWWGWDIFHDSWARGRRTGSILNLPSWGAELSVPVGFALLALQSLAELATLRNGATLTLGSSHE